MSAYLALCITCTARGLALALMLGQGREFEVLLLLARLVYP